MRLALLSPLPPDPSRLAHHAAQFRRALNLGGIDVLTPLVGQRPLESLEAARAWVAERDWRGVDVVHAELAPGQRTVYWVLQALARLPHGPALTATVHAPPGLLGQPLHAPFAGVYHARWLPRLTRQASAWLAKPFTRHSDRRLARRLAGVLCTSDASATRLARRLGLPRERITVLPQGLPELACPPLPPGPLKLLCLSGPGQALRPLQDLVATLGQLVAQGGDDLPPWQLTLAGATAASCFEPPRHDPLTRLQADPRLKALGDRIAWQLDPDPQDLPALMAAHHLLVLPGRRQPWGLGEGGAGPAPPFPHPLAPGPGARQPDIAQGADSGARRSRSSGGVHKPDQIAPHPDRAPGCLRSGLGRRAPLAGGAAKRAGRAGHLGQRRHLHGG